MYYISFIESDSYDSVGVAARVARSVGPCRRSLDFSYDPVQAAARHQHSNEPICDGDGLDGWTSKAAAERSLWELMALPEDGRIGGIRRRLPRLQSCGVPATASRERLHSAGRAGTVPTKSGGRGLRRRFW